MVPVIIAIKLSVWGAENLTTKFNFWRGSDKIPKKGSGREGNVSLINRKETPNYENIYSVV